MRKSLYFLKNNTHNGKNLRISYPSADVMYYMLLEQLLRSLSADELAKLRKELVLPARSQKIFEYFQNESPAPTTRELCGEFGLTKSNLYRLCSEITNECVSILAISGEFPKLEFFKKKFLVKQFTAELARTETKLLQEADADVLERYYDLAFTGMMGFPVTQIDMSLVKSYGMKWHLAMRNPPVDHELEIELRILFIRIGALPIWKKMNVDMMRALSRSLLDEVSRRASVTPNPVARYFYYQSEWKAANYDKVVGKERTKWIERSLEIIAAHESSFPPASLDTTELQLAYERAMYCGEIEVGYERFKRSYCGQVPDTSRNSLFILRYIRLSIMARQFETAKEILGVLEAHPYVRMTLGIYQPYLHLRSTLHVLEGEIEHAERLNAISHALNVDENFFLSYEVEIRELELICAYKRNNFELAELLIARDLKWLQSRKYSLSQSAWPYFYHTVKAFIMYKMTGDKPRPLLRQHFEELRTTHMISTMILQNDVDEMYSE